MNVPTLSPRNRGYDVVTMTTVCGIASAPRGAELEAPGHDDRLDQHAGGELRLPLPPLDEDDRHFADAAAVACGVEEHLHQKGVAVRDHGVEGEAGERFAPPAPEAARAVRRGQPRDRADVAVRK